MPNSVIRAALKRKAKDEVPPTGSSSASTHTRPGALTPSTESQPSLHHHHFLRELTREEKKNNRRKFPKEIMGYGPDGPIYRKHRTQHGQTVITLPEDAPTPEPPPLSSLDPPTFRNIDNVFRVHLDLPFDPNNAPNNTMNPKDKRSLHSVRKHAQAARWDATVLPALLRPFMAYTRRRAETRMHGELQSAPRLCTCAGWPREVTVTCVSQESVQDVKLLVCHCRNTPIQLVERGMFPCSPVNPRMAFNIDMLDFVSNLFVRMAPNQRAWSATLASYLEARGYKFTTADSLRRRFGDALTRYQNLLRLANAEVTEAVERAREELLFPLDHSPIRISSQSLDESTAVSDRTYINSISTSLPASTSQTTNASASPTLSHDPQLQSIPESRPSAYLRSRCPLCFGGSYTCTEDERVQAIVCIDANFQLKRNTDKDRRKSRKGERGERDPPVTSPQTIFVPQSTCDEWEKKLDVIRGTQPSARRSKTNKSDYDTSAHHDCDCDDCDNHDILEPSMTIPKSVLDQCEGSFIAADGDRIKASTQYFDDTGVMAMLCHHDHPLFLVNMRTAGEKQFYALALLSSLMDHLPSHWRIGLLYDIACQLHRSLGKWPELSGWLPRMEFAVSVFHAYGHQWICQLWYHPRKSDIWGLSDGEGCERFWSELRKLIPNLRVTGYHRRLFVIDLQVEHIDQMKQEGLGKWLQERVTRTQKRLATAKLALGDRDAVYLQSQFQAQRAFQSKPLARQSKTRAEKEVNTIIALSDTIASMKAMVASLRAELSGLMTSNLQGTTDQRKQLALQIQAELESVNRVQKTIDSKTKALSAIDENAVLNLEKIRKDKWVNAQLNLRVLRDQILAKLRSRRFELANLERAYRTRMLDKNTQDHAEQAIKRREPGISATVKRYNTRLQELRDLKLAGHAPPNTVIPSDLEHDKLYHLDVDSDIFNDILNVDLSEFPDGKPPAWLADDNVKTGIRLAQEIRNCERELHRCKMECSNLQIWFKEEYEAHATAIRDCGDVDLCFHLRSRQQGLERLLRLWKSTMKDVPFEAELESWFPANTPSTSFPRVPDVRGQEDHPGHSRYRESDVDSSDDEDQDGLEDDEIGIDFSIIATLDRHLVTETIEDLAESH